MVAETEAGSKSRTPLSRERVLSAAVKVADEGGIEALTMRGLAESLDVEAMSLYYHVANKEALLDGVADMIIEELLEEVAPLETDLTRDWKGALRERSLAARRVMLRHKWAPAVLETRTRMSPPLLLYFNGILEIFKAGGLSYDLAHHALHALGSRVLGFTQEMFDPAPGSDDEEVNDAVMAEMMERLPYLVEMMGEIAHDDGPDDTIGWCDDQTEFIFALDLMLDGLERLAAAE
jgi:AcrR family transcriptional regulator